MPVYNYQVRDKTSGKTIRGKITADNAGLVRKHLSSAGHSVLSISEQNKLEAILSSDLGSNKVKRKDVAIFARQFATMIDAGIPITKCLSILSHQTESKPLRSVILQLATDVEAGMALSDAITKHPKAFPVIFITMVRAGEVGGVLDVVLERLAEHFENELAIVGKIKSAVSYPISMGVLVVLIAMAMLVWIVPVFAEMFSSAGAELPLITRVMMSASDVMRSWQGLIWLGAFILIAFIFRWWKNSIGRRTWDRLIITMPVVGPIAKKMVISRFTRTFATLVSAGVPMLTTLEIVAGASTNSIVSDVIMEARTNVREGNSLSEPFAKSPVFPAMVAQMMSVGEESGALDTMLAKVADFYDDEVSAAVDALTSTLEPIMMGVLGGIVGTMVIGLYLPMFQLVTIAQ